MDDVRYIAVVEEPAPYWMPMPNIHVWEYGSADKRALMMALARSRGAKPLYAINFRQKPLQDIPASYWERRGITRVDLYRG